MALRFANVARDVARLLSVNLVSRALGIAALIAYARLLPPVELAALPVFFILGSFVTVPLNFGLFPTLMREIPVLLERDRTAALGMIRAVVLTVAAGIMVVGLGYLTLAPRIARLLLSSSDWSWLIRWMIPGAVARGLDDILTFLLRSTREFSSLAQKKLVAEVGTPLVTVPLIYFWGVRGLVIGLTLGVVFGLLWALYRARYYLFQRSKVASLLPLVRRSRPYYVEGGLFFLTNQGDQALVAALLSPTALAGYYVARRIPDALALLLLSVEEVMGPTLARASVDGAAELRRMFQGFSVTVAVFVLPAAALAACFAPVYTKLVGAASYGSVTPAVIILALGLVAQGAITVISQSALALGHPRDRLKVTVVLACLLLILTAASARFGLTAVAIGRVTALLLATLVGAQLLRHLLPPLPWRDISRLLVPTAVLAGTAISLQRLSEKLWLVPAYGAAAVVLFLATLFAVSSPIDRGRLTTLWRGRQ